MKFLKKFRKLIIIPVALAGLVLLGAADCDDTEKQELQEITVKLKNGDTVTCLVAYDEYDTYIEAHDCLEPDTK